MAEDDVKLREWDVDPDLWPHTPPLDVWRALYADDDNLVWRAGIGHVVNALDEALDRVEAAEAAVEQWKATCVQWSKEYATAWQKGYDFGQQNQAARPVRTTCAVLHVDADGSTVPCPGEPEPPTAKDVS